MVCEALCAALAAGGGVVLQLLLLLPGMLLRCYASSLLDAVGATCIYVLLPVAGKLIAEH